MAKKGKKEKIIYIDDGRTIADMSALSGGRKPSAYSSPSRFKEIWKTYWSATKMMLLPTLVICGGICVIFLILLLLFTVM